MRIIHPRWYRPTPLAHGLILVRRHLYIETTPGSFGFPWTMMTILTVKLWTLSWIKHIGFDNYRTGSHWWEFSNTSDNGFPPTYHDCNMTHTSKCIISYRVIREIICRQLGTRPSASTVLDRLLLYCNCTQHTYCIIAIGEAMFERGLEVFKPLVSLLLAG